MIIARAPFRLPIGGGGTDLPSYFEQFEGSLITAAINKYMYLNINEPAVSNVIKVGYSRTEIVPFPKFENIQHDIVRETIKYLQARKPLEINSVADLSAGTGMGSSSSYTVALLKALNTLYKKDKSVQDLAEEACMVEINLCKKPIGKQDQYAAAFGGIIQMNIAKDGKVNVEHLELDKEVIHELEDRLMMFYTDIQRDANIILGEQSQKIKAAFSSNNEKGSNFTALDAMHKIKEIGLEIKKCLFSGDIDQIGNLMHDHWTIKKKVSTNMSNPSIDAWYNLAVTQGALGGKIMGAGGGGFFVFIVKKGSRTSLKNALEKSGLKHMDFKFDFEGVKVLANV